MSPAAACVVLASARFLLHLLALVSDNDTANPPPPLFFNCSSSHHSPLFLFSRSFPSRCSECILPLTARASYSRHSLRATSDTMKHLPASTRRPSLCLAQSPIPAPPRPQVNLREESRSLPNASRAPFFYLLALANCSVPFTQDRRHHRSPDQHRRTRPAHRAWGWLP